MDQSDLQLAPLLPAPAKSAGALSDAVAHANVANGAVTGAGA